MEPLPTTPASIADILPMNYTMSWSMLNLLNLIQYQHDMALTKSEQLPVAFDVGSDG